MPCSSKVSLNSSAQTFGLAGLLHIGEYGHFRAVFCVALKASSAISKLAGSEEYTSESRHRVCLRAIPSAWEPHQAAQDGLKHGGFQSQIQAHTTAWMAFSNEASSPSGRSRWTVRCSRSRRSDPVPLAYTPACFVVPQGPRQGAGRNNVQFCKGAFPMGGPRNTPRWRKQSKAFSRARA